MKRSTAMMMIVGVTLFLGAFLLPTFAQTLTGQMINGKKITVPKSSIPRPGHINTNYFFVGDQKLPAPPQGAETPGSVACVYELVSGPKGCPINSSTNLPTGGVGAIAIVDAGYYPTAASDLHTFSSYYGIPDADFQVVFADGKQPPVYNGWLVEQALDIEWAHAMAPKAKLFLVESKLWHTDPTWQAVKVASDLVAQNGGGVISMSWGIHEWKGERNKDKYFTTPGVVYFGGAGDWGLNFSFTPAASPYVIGVGGTLFNRDGNGDFVSEQYATGSGGGGISIYEPRPSYQNVIKDIVGSKRGYPDVASDYCCTDIYVEGNWYEVGGTSWASPTFAGIVNSAGLLKKSTRDELTMIYSEYANQDEYKKYFYDITEGDSNCKVGWDICSGVGSPRTYGGK